MADTVQQIGSLIGSSQDAGTRKPQHVLVVDSAGAEQSVGGGTQYTEGDTDSSITGTAAMTEGPSNTLTPLQSNAAKDLKVVPRGDADVITRRDNYTAAQTDTAIVSVSAGTKIVVVSMTAVLGGNATVKAAIRVGFGAANTPTSAGVYLSHPNVVAGSGVAERIPVVGADGEDLRITCAVPTGDSFDVVTKYYTVPA